MTSKKTIMEILTTMISDALKNTGKSIEEIASITGFSCDKIRSYIERTDMPNLNNFLKIADALGIDAKETLDLRKFFEDRGLYINARDIIMLNLSQVIKDSEISQKELAKSLGLSCETINNYVAKNHCPNLTHLIAIAAAINVNIDDIITAEIKKLVLEEEKAKNEFRASIRLKYRKNR